MRCLKTKPKDVKTADALPAGNTLTGVITLTKLKMMQKHIQNYLKHFDIGEQDVWMCEACTRQFHINNGLEIHHIIFRSHGGTDDVKNCICLCVKCHTKAHNEKLSKGELQYIHNNFLLGNRINFVK